MGVVISAAGGHVTKAVTIVELLKKKFPVSAKINYPPTCLTSSDIK